MAQLGTDKSEKEKKLQTKQKRTNERKEEKAFN